MIFNVLAPRDLAGLLELLLCSAGGAILEAPPAQWRSWSCGGQTQGFALTLRVLVNGVGWAEAMVLVVAFGG